VANTALDCNQALGGNTANTSDDDLFGMILSI
jgi:hypothetical protein